MKIELFQWEAGDWVALFVNGERFDEGHSIPQHEWIGLLEKAGCEVVVREIEDENGEFCHRGVEILRENAR